MVLGRFGRWLAFRWLCRRFIGCVAIGGRGNFTDPEYVKKAHVISRGRLGFKALFP